MVNHNQNNFDAGRLVIYTIIEKSTIVKKNLNKSEYFMGSYVIGFFFTELCLAKNIIGIAN